MNAADRKYFDQNHAEMSDVLERIASALEAVAVAINYRPRYVMPEVPLKSPPMVYPTTQPYWQSPPVITNSQPDNIAYNDQDAWG